MGATVLLFNRYERIIQRSLTNERGAFGFESLPPDLYSVRVSLTSFMPAMKHQIAVQPGMQSLLHVNLATLLSSVELVYAAPGQGALMSDDWKWTLKTATSTRPVLRILPQISISDPNATQHPPGAIFSDTRGILQVSGGESDGVNDLDNTDLGTAFALATSVFGRSKLQVSGDIMLTSGSAIPSGGFRTSYSRDNSDAEGNGPEISVTMHQLSLPARVGGGSGTDGLPVLRTVSVATIDRIAVNRSAPAGVWNGSRHRLLCRSPELLQPLRTAELRTRQSGTLRIGYSSGAPPAELLSATAASTEGDSAALHQDLTTLALAPRISLRDSSAQVQRTQSFEVGYEKKVAGRTVNVTAYQETVTNGALTMAGATNLLPAGDVLPSLSATSGTFDVGTYQRYGYSACIVQPVGDKFEIAGSSGSGGVLLAGSSLAEAATGDDVRSRIHAGQRYWASVRVSGTLPRLGTQISSSYQWMDNDALMPTHLYLTQNLNQETGWNVHIRQPLPGFFGMPGRVEATADLRNMLAQGYLSIPTAGGRPILLMQAPRSLRGGLSFIF